MAVYVFIGGKKPFLAYKVAKLNCVNLVELVDLDVCDGRPGPGRERLGVRSRVVRIGVARAAVHAEQMNLKAFKT